MRVRERSATLTQAELDARTEQFLNASAPAPRPNGDPSIDQRINTYLVEGDSPKQDGAFTPKFAKGDKVFVKNVRKRSRRR